MIFIENIAKTGYNSTKKKRGRRMNNNAKNVVEFYVLSNKLKNKLRAGWQYWNITKERAESVAEHIYGTCMLAIAMYSEYDFDIDLYKVVTMIALHEVEEIQMEDYTPLDKISEDEKRKLGKDAIEYVLSNLSNKNEYISLIAEYNERNTKEAKFAYLCDKLEKNMQAKLYDEEKVIDLYNGSNKYIREDKRVIKMMSEGSKTASDIFIDYDKPVFNDEQFRQVLDYIQNNDILN